MPEQQPSVNGRSMSQKATCTAVTTAGGNEGTGPHARPPAVDQGRVVFAEALFVRGLVSTLLANASVQEGAAAVVGSGEGGPCGTACTAQAQQGALVAEDGEQHQQRQQHGGGARRVAGGSSGGLRGFGPLLGRGCRGTDLVWWDAIQPQMAMADPMLARCGVHMVCVRAHVCAVGACMHACIRSGVLGKVGCQVRPGVVVVCGMW